MNIQQLAQNLHASISQFVDHKDFSTEGNKLFKIHQNNILQYTKVRECIPVCLFILQHETRHEIQYFASFILKDKLKFDFQQLQGNIISEALSKLLQIIGKHAQLSKIVILNISLCLVYIYIHYADKFTGILSFLDQTFSKIQASLTIDYFCKVLELVPQEILNSKMVIDEQKREDVMAILKKQQRQVLIKLHNTAETLSQNPNANKGILFDIFTNWIDVEYSKEIMNDLQNHKVLQLSFQSLHIIKETQRASGCLLKTINMISPEQKIFQFMAQNIFVMLGRIDKIIEEDQQIAENYIRIFSQFGIKSSRAFIQGYNQIIKNYIFKMLQFTKMKQFQVFDDLLYFWRSFLFELRQRQKSSTITTQQIKQIISNLYYALCVRIRYSDQDMEHLNTIQENRLYQKNKEVEDLHQLRDDVRDIFQTIQEIINQEEYLNMVMGQIKSLNPTSKNFWQTLQGYLFSLRDSLSSYPKLSTDVIDLVKLYDQVGHKYQIIRRNFITIFEKLFSIQDKNLHFLNKLFQNILLMFSKQFMFERAEKAFAKGCQKNPNLLCENIQQILQLLIKYPNKQHILQGIMSVLKTQQNVLKQYLANIWNVSFEILKTSVVKKQKIQTFDSFFTIMYSVSDEDSEYIFQIMTKLFQQIWPNLKYIFQNPTKNYTQQDRLIERSCKLIKLFMRKLKVNFLKYIQQVFNTLVVCYKNHPIGPYIYLFEVAITVYGKDTNPEVLNYLQNIYLQFYQLTFHHLNTIGDSFSQLQYLIQDFLGLHIRIFVYNSAIILNTGKVAEMIKFNSQCLISDVPKLASTSSHLFESIFMIYWNPYSRQKYKKQGLGEVVNLSPENTELYNQLRDFIQPSIPQLVKDLFKSLQTGPAQYVRQNIIDALMAALLAFPTNNVEIWSQPIQSLSEDILTQTQKLKYLQLLKKMVSNNVDEFDLGEIKIKKLLYTITRRFLNRKNRQNIAKQIQ